MRRLEETGRWLFLDPLALWASLATPFFAWALAAVVPGHPEFRVRVAATLVSTVGVILVVRDMLSTQRLFERATLWQRVTQWAARGRRIWSAPREIVGAGTLPLAFSFTGSAATMRHSDGTIESRVRILEERLASLDTTVGSLAHSVDVRVEELRTAVDFERTSRTSEVGRLAQRLSTVAADGFSGEVFGVALLIWGQVFSTFPEELGHLLN